MNIIIGFTGEDCSVERECIKNCNERGKCIKGECICDNGYEGSACEMMSTCSDECSGNRGKCTHGQCLCPPGYEGLRCEFKI